MCVGREMSRNGIHEKLSMKRSTYTVTSFMYLKLLSYILKEQTLLLHFRQLSSSSTQNLATWLPRNTQLPAVRR